MQKPADPLIPVSAMDSIPGQTGLGPPGGLAVAGSHSQATGKNFLVGARSFLDRLLALIRFCPVRPKAAPVNGRRAGIIPTLPIWKTVSILFVFLPFSVRGPLVPGSATAHSVCSNRGPPPLSSRKWIADPPPAFVSKQSCDWGPKPGEKPEFAIWDLMAWAFLSGAFRIGPAILVSGLTGPADHSSFYGPGQSQTGRFCQGAQFRPCPADEAGVPGNTGPPFWWVGPKNGLGRAAFVNGLRDGFHCRTRRLARTANIPLAGPAGAFFFRAWVDGLRLSEESPFGPVGPRAASDHACFFFRHPRLIEFGPAWGRRFPLAAAPTQNRS